MILISGHRINRVIMYWIGNDENNKMAVAMLSDTWWRHQMETFSALLAICAGNSLVTGEFPAQRPVTRSFDVFFDLRPNKRLSKQSWGWWFEMSSCPLWRHSNALSNQCLTYCTLDPRIKLAGTFQAVHLKSWLCIWKYRLQNEGHFVQASLFQIKGALMVLPINLVHSSAAMRFP